MERRRAIRKRRKRPGRRTALAGLLDGIPDSPHIKPRRKLVNFLVSEAELDEMRGTAKSLGLTVSAYLRGLHRTAADALRGRRGGGHG